MNRFLFLSLLFLSFYSPVLAENESLTYSGYISAETRFFSGETSYSSQDNVSLSPSIAIEPELVWEQKNGSNRMVIRPFLRFDNDDDNRSHFDIREFKWLHSEENWDVVAGVDQISWGVAESHHLVDIINQTDLVEDIDREDKLGQQLINLNLYGQRGILGLFVLPGFREQTFPDNQARLRGGYPIDEKNATYDSGAKEKHVDLAVRWKQSFGIWDFGIYHFYGTSRNPTFIPQLNNFGEVSLVPHYDLIHQTGLDLQMTSDRLLLKLEAFYRAGHGDPFLASVWGLEYTFFQFQESQADLGILAEYHNDKRNSEEAPYTSFDNDLFVGWRLALNDEKDTIIVGGPIIDLDHQTTFLFFEASRRITNSIKFEFEGRYFLNVSENDPAYGIRNEDFTTLRIVTYF